MPQPPIPSPTPSYRGGYAPDPSFAQGAAAGEYEAMLSRYRAYENERREEFFMACMFGKGYQVLPVLLREGNTRDNIQLLRPYGCPPTSDVEGLSE